MRRTPLARWSMRLAAFLRRVVSALERVSGSQDARMAALARRYPGAPEHWLRHIARRAPQLAQSPPAAIPEPPRVEVPRRHAEPPPLHLAPPGTPRRAPPLEVSETRPGPRAVPTDAPRAPKTRPYLRLLPAHTPPATKQVDIPERGPRPFGRRLFAALRETSRDFPYTDFPESKPASRPEARMPPDEHMPRDRAAIRFPEPTRMAQPSPQDSLSAHFPALPRARKGLAVPEAPMRRPVAVPDIPDSDGPGRWPDLPALDDIVLDSPIDPPRLDALRREQEDGLWSG